MLLLFVRLFVVGWMAKLKEANSMVKIVPRILFDGWTKSDYLELFTDSALMTSVGNVIRQQLEVMLPLCSLCVLLFFPPLLCCVLS